MILMSMLARATKIFAIGFALFFALPLGAQALIHFAADKPGDWSSADWSATGLLPAAKNHAPAMVRILAARTGRWRGIFADHSWIVIKPRGGEYERYDVVAWGKPLRMNHRAPDARWFSNDPHIVFAADGAAAEQMIGPLRAAIRAYPNADHGQYRVWPGPNSNTFVACVLERAHIVSAVLPPTAIGKDYPCDGAFLSAGLTPSRTGVRVRLGGYFGAMLGWREGLEISLLGSAAGFDFARPAIKLPGLGRIGMSAV